MQSKSNCQDNIVASFYVIFNCSFHCIHRGSKTGSYTWQAPRQRLGGEDSSILHPVFNFWAVCMDEDVKCSWSFKKAECILSGQVTTGNLQNGPSLWSDRVLRLSHKCDFTKGKVGVSFDRASSSMGVLDRNEASTLQIYIYKERRLNLFGYQCVIKIEFPIRGASI